MRNISYKNYTANEDVFTYISFKSFKTCSANLISEQKSKDAFINMPSRYNQMLSVFCSSLPMISLKVILHY